MSALIKPRGNDLSACSGVYSGVAVESCMSTPWVVSTKRCTHALDPLKEGISARSALTSLIFARLRRHDAPRGHLTPTLPCGGDSHHDETSTALSFIAYFNCTTSTQFILSQATYFHLLTSPHPTPTSRPRLLSHSRETYTATILPTRRLFTMAVMDARARLGALRELMRERNIGV